MSDRAEGMARHVKHDMLMFVIGEINYDETGAPRVVNQDDSFARPTERDIKLVRKYAWALDQKVAYLRHWAMEADALLAAGQGGGQ